ncbi:putative cytosol aminopeptidase [Rhodococcoides trifolii]|uniref:Probable cytosol aminopeptidase n=1 Tax=Rhodococcoides trifolii TaxID=908250 RepID=A0A917CYU4_9NOCA|nr:leucyl aminopeptidase [Rhodococcus trifolii]GGG05050.1 putative cytosol aminopeptidase [Rhodococcus trifolii]
MSTQQSRTLGPEIALAGAIGAKTDVVVVGLIKADDGLQVVGGSLLNDHAAAVLLALKAVGATGRAEQITRVPAPAGLGATSVVAVGLGTDDERSPDSVRRAAGVAARSLSGTDTATTTLSTLDIGASAEGFYLGAYQFSEFKSAKSAPKEDAAPVRRIELLVDSPRSSDAKSALARGLAIAEAVATARDLVNTPPSHLFPAEFADRAKTLGTEAGLAVQILDEKALEKGGYGGIIGVGKGSSRPPRLVRMTYKGGKRGKPSVALVGKGITFDTGGISIKPAAGMENMTSDMAGAAAVVATVVLAAKLKLPLDVTAWVPMAENMPSATAQRPGDVLTQYGGTTVEVINTDAEGRLVLADAMVRACEENPDYLIDTATLTGAQTVALGNRTPGVMGTEVFRDRVAVISQTVGEDAWPMPMPKELRADLDSKVADLANVTNHRYGGMLAAALYLKEFVAEGVQWAHIDVAGPAYNTSGPHGYTSKGGTGVPVRTMFSVLEDIAENG